MSADLYSILGIQRGAESSEIRKAFTKLAKTHHPDKGGDAEEFKKIHKAFEILSNEEKRKIYDMTGQIPGEEEVQMGGGMPGGMFGGGGFPFDIGNLFGMFGPHMAGGGPRRRGMKPPPKMEHLRLPLAQFYHGNISHFSIDRTKICTTCTGDGAKKKDVCAICHGSGHQTQVINLNGMTMHSRGPCTVCMGQGSRVLEKCDICSGSGKVSEKKTLDARIQPGTQAGEVLVFQEACSELPEFEKPGDLHIVINQEEDKNGWKRSGEKGQHLENTVTITLAESLVGCVVRLQGHPNYEEGLYIKIPAASFSGDVYCISGQGMPLKGQTGLYGDIYITVQVTVKHNERHILSSETCQLILKEQFGSKVRIPDNFEEGKTEVCSDLFLSRV